MNSYGLPVRVLTKGYWTKLAGPGYAKLRRGSSVERARRGRRKHGAAMTG